MFRHQMKDVSEVIARWLEQKRRRDRVSAAVISILALGGGAAVFLFTSLLIYGVLFIPSGAFLHSVPWLGPVALGVTAAIYVRLIKRRQDDRQLRLDPMGVWILKDVFSAGPRLLLEGLRQARCYGQLGELNVPACARALVYLAGQNSAVDWEELVQHCATPEPRLREQLSLLDGVLFLGQEGHRVTLLDPFRLRLRWMLRTGREAEDRTEPVRPRPEPAPQPLPVNEPEKLGVYEILGLSASASAVEIKAAYRKRVKECHPDLFAGMDPQARALAERWTKALNSAYATLKPRHGIAKPSSTADR